MPIPSPLFSVVIPIYKVAHYLPQCLESVVNQPLGQPIEIILVDDGSPDECPTLCDNYAAQDNRIIVIHKKNGGLSSARNAGMSIASGEYVVFLDGDDFFAPNALQNIANTVIMANKPDVVLLRWQRCDANDGIIKEEWPYQYEKQKLSGMDAVDLHKYLCNKITPAAWLRAGKLSFLTENLLFFAEGILHEDLHWTPLVMLNAKSFGFCNDITYIYRKDRPGSIMQTRDIRRAFDKLWIIDALLRQATMSSYSVKQINALQDYCSDIFYRLIFNYRDYTKDTRIKELNKVMKKHLYVLLYAKRYKFYFFYVLSIIFNFSIASWVLFLMRRWKVLIWKNLIKK